MTGTALASKIGWLITDGKTGMEVQCVGVADALGLNYIHKRVSPNGLWRFLAPWAPVSPREKFGQAGSQFSPPWPDIAIACGRLSIPYIRRLRNVAGPATYTVVLQDPRTGENTADIIWVPQHDRFRAHNVITTLTAPHSFSPHRLGELRLSAPKDIKSMPHPRVAIVLGGPNSVFNFPEVSIKRLSDAIASIARLDVSFLITPSRRTPPALMTSVEQATRNRPRLIWDGQSANPYPYFVACSDYFIVTADSVNMTGEACVSGKPVYVFRPEGGSAKFERFHEALRRYGATRELPKAPEELESWSYTPLDSSGIIAARIEQRWMERQNRS